MNTDFLPFEFIAAIRFLREGIVQTILIIVGVSVGVAVIVFMSAILSGLQGNLLARVLSTQPQIIISPRRETASPSYQENGATILRISQARAQRKTTIDQWQKLTAVFRKMPTINIVSATASGPIFVYHGAAVRSVTLTGINPESYFRYVTLPDYIVAGSANIGQDDILIGRDLADDLGIKINDKILVRSSKSGPTNLRVKGLFDYGNAAFNSRSVFTQLNLAQGLLRISSQITAIDLTLKDPYTADTMADTLASLYSVEADSWIRTNAQFFMAIKSQNISTIVIRLCVALSVALGVASVLVVSVTQRSREIGILRAIGASQGQILRVFLIQGGIVALIGSVLGSVLARGILAIWMAYARNPDGTPFFEIGIEPSLYVIASAIATVCGVLAATIPAARASKLDPVVAIRG